MKKNIKLKNITPKNIKLKNGFTLIEVILSMTILASMMVLVAISIGRATKAQRKIQSEIEAVSGLRDAMRIIRNDINQAYNHNDFELDIKDQSKKKTVQNNQQQRPGQPPIPPLPQPPEPPPTQSNRISPATKFVGNDNSLNFITMNNGKITANDIQADFVEVGYFLKNCKSISGDGGQAVSTKKSQGSQCLFRRVQKVIDDDVTKGGDETMLLDDITEFSLKYLIEGQLDWVKEWKAEKKRYNIFPTAVEVTLAIEKELEGKQRKYSIQYVVPIHFPNNIKPSSSSSATPTGQTSLEGLPQK